MTKPKRRKVNQHTKPRKGVTVTLSWDGGATGPANQHGLIEEQRGAMNIETGTVENPNGVKGYRRVDMLEYYHRNGVVSKRGFTAGEKLRNAWEATQRAPGWNDNDRVQSSPKPDQAVAMQIDRMTKLVAISRKVPPEYAAIIEHIAYHKGSVHGVKVKGVRPYVGRKAHIGKEAVRVAFEALADAMGH